MKVEVIEVIEIIKTTVKIEVRTKQAPSANYEYSDREKYKSLKNIIVK